jgi:hypothetical protein
MSFRSTRARALALAALLAAPTRVQAHDDGHHASRFAPLRRFASNHDWGVHAQSTPIPRTFSYYYAPWFNQPCHFKVVGPDGKTRWRTTVRGLPLGTPWPSYAVPGQP